MPVTETWVEDLQNFGPRREEAVERLHELLLGAARKEGWRRDAFTPSLRGEARDNIAREPADDDLFAVLCNLDSYRGLSRFTTWAYKFAVLEAAVAVRQRAWQGRGVVLDSEGWSGLAAGASSPAQEAETSELLGHITRVIRDELSDRQREVLLA